MLIAYNHTSKKTQLEPTIQLWWSLSLVGGGSMTIKLVGSTSGSVSKQAPASTTGGANRVLTLPDVDGTVATTTTAGKILQVVQSTKTNTQSIQSQTFTDVTGLSATITPSSTSSKILVTFNISIGCNNYGMINLLRGSTNIFGADGNRIQCTIAVTGIGSLWMTKELWN